MADLFKNKADLFKNKADMFKNLADMFKKMADMFKKRGQFWDVRLLVFRLREGWAGPQMPTTKNIERQMFSVGDPISQKNSTSGFTWDRIPSKTK